MAVVNLDTGKIIGCKKNSRTYKHEQAHLIFDKISLGMRVKYYHYFFIMILVTILPFNLFIDNLLLKIYCLILGWCVFGTYLFEEVWCWIRAYKN